VSCVGRHHAGGRRTCVCTIILAQVRGSAQGSQPEQDVIARCRVWERNSKLRGGGVAQAAGARVHAHGCENSGSGCRTEEEELVAITIQLRAARHEEAQVAEEE
jgi:hypothetical protein